MKWHGTLLFAVLLIPSVCVADEPAIAVVDCEEAYRQVPYDSILDLLDPEAPAERRAQALGVYQRLAEIRECPEFGYTLGQLYRHGPDLPGNPLPRDTPKALELIRAMAEDGYLAAYADLAEMVMRHGEPREAMQWTQVYLYFVRNTQRPQMDADDAQFHRSAYNGHLLTRAEVVWTWPKRPLPRRLVREDLNAYLAEHGKAVEKRMLERLEGERGRVSAQDGVGLRMLSGVGDCRLNIRDRVGAATASWIVEVLPSGQKGRVVLENFVPSPAAAERLKQCLQRYEFAPFDGDQPRTVRISLMFGSPEGAAFRR